MPKWFYRRYLADWSDGLPQFTEEPEGRDIATDERPDCRPL